MKFNIFVSNRFINAGGNYVDWDGLRSMMNSGIVGIGAHTYNHIDSRLIRNDELFNHEILDANREIEEELGIYPSDFCFPYGYYDRQIVNRLTEKKVYKRLYTSNCIRAVRISECDIVGRTGISTDDTMRIFKNKIMDRYRVIKYYSRFIGAQEIEINLL